MPKQRMSTADVAGEVACLRQTCLGMRVANIYDLDSRTYLLKLQRSGEDGSKTFLLLESGNRFHTTQTLKERRDAPSNFTLKLRKHIRTRRLEDVRQLGVDRIVDFSFGTGEATYHIILELYSQGNVILTDGRYEVLTLLRSHRDDARGIATMPRHPYPLHSIRLAQPVTAEVWGAALAAADAAAPLRSVLASVLMYGPHVADHCLLSAGLQPSIKASEAQLSKEQQERLLQQVAGFEAWVARCADAPPAGYITLAKPGESRKQRAAALAAPLQPQQSAPLEQQQQPDSQQQPVGEEQQQQPNSQQLVGHQEQHGAAQPADEDGLVYSEFEPLPWAQNAGRPVKEFLTFDAALDEFFSKVEDQRAEVAQQAAVRTVMSKLDKVREDQAARAEALGREADAEEDKAALIEYNMTAVDAAIDALNAALARGLDWRELGALIEAEKRAGNPVAALVGGLALERNAATLLLRNLLDDEEDSDEEELQPQAPTPVEVDLGMNAAANARARHEARKRAAAKQRKTLEANAKALAAAEQKTAAQLAQVQAKAVRTREVRPAAWFERFAWFVSSENYLVLSARDGQQADLLIKRHMRKGDVFVHADLQGAPVTVIKNADPASPVPPLTISQAGAACVCNSAAWDAKVVTSAWWCAAEQVSKVDATGQQLPAGAVSVQGKKNFLPPHPLVMGLAFLFVLDEASAAGHAGERTAKSADAAADALVAADSAAGDAEHAEKDLSAASSSDSEGDAGSADGGASAGADVGTLSLADSSGAARQPAARNGSSGGGSGSLQNSSRNASGGAGGSGGGSGDGGGLRSASRDGSDGGVGRGVRSSADSMDRRPDVRRNLQTSGSAALSAFLDGSADPRTGAFSRYGLLEAQPSSSSAAAPEAQQPVGDDESTPQGGSRPDPAAAEEIRQAVVEGGPVGRRHLSAAARRAARKQGLAPGAALPPAECRAAADATEAGLAGDATVAGSNEEASEAGLAEDAASAAVGRQQATDVGGSAAATEQPSAQVQPGGGSQEGGGSGAVTGSGGVCGSSAGGSGSGGDNPMEAARAAERARVAAKQEKAAQAQRGKAAKLKKVRQKYADQDEEDRALAMAALASAGGRKERGDKKQARKARRDARRPAEAAPAPLHTVHELEAVNARPIGAQRTWGHEAKQAAAEAKQAAAAKLQATADAAAAQDASEVAAARDVGEDAGKGAAAAAQAAPQPAEAEDAEDAEEAEEGDQQAAADLQRLRQLDAMTGMPRDEDVVLHVLPVCAPYSVLAAYRYKAKLTPGSQKRGKAARQVVELLTQGANVPATHVEAIKHVPEPDVIAACRGGVKVSIPGLQAAKAAAKAGRKKSKN